MSRQPALRAGRRDFATTNPDHHPRGGRCPPCPLPPETPTARAHYAGRAPWGERSPPSGSVSSSATACPSIISRRIQSVTGGIEPPAPDGPEKLPCCGIGGRPIGRPSPSRRVLPPSRPAGAQGVAPVAWRTLAPSVAAPYRSRSLQLAPGALPPTFAPPRSLRSLGPVGLRPPRLRARPKAGAWESGRGFAPFLFFRLRRPPL